MLELTTQKNAKTEVPRIFAETMTKFSANVSSALWQVNTRPGQDIPDPQEQAKKEAAVAAHDDLMTFLENIPTKNQLDTVGERYPRYNGRSLDATDLDTPKKKLLNRMEKYFVMASTVSAMNSEQLTPDEQKNQLDKFESLFEDIKNGDPANNEPPLNELIMQVMADTDYQYIDDPHFKAIMDISDACVNLEENFNKLIYDNKLQETCSLIDQAEQQKAEIKSDISQVVMYCADKQLPPSQLVGYEVTLENNKIRTNQKMLDLQSNSTKMMYEQSRRGYLEKVGELEEKARYRKQQYKEKEQGLNNIDMALGDLERDSYFDELEKDLANLKNEYATLDRQQRILGAEGEEQVKMLEGELKKREDSFQQYLKDNDINSKELFKSYDKYLSEKERTETLMDVQSELEMLALEEEKLAEGLRRMGKVAAKPRYDLPPDDRMVYLVERYEKVANKLANYLPPEQAAKISTDPEQRSKQNIVVSTGPILYIRRTFGENLQNQAMEAQKNLLAATADLSTKTNDDNAVFVAVKDKVQDIQEVKKLIGEYKEGGVKYFKRQKLQQQMNEVQAQIDSKKEDLVYEANQYLARVQGKDTTQPMKKHEIKAIAEQSRVRLEAQRKNLASSSETVEETREIMNLKAKAERFSENSLKSNILDAQKALSKDAQKLNEVRAVREKYEALYQKQRVYKAQATMVENSRSRLNKEAPFDSVVAQLKSYSNSLRSAKRFLPHSDSPEFLAMERALKEAVSPDNQGKSKEEMEQLLGNLSHTADEYIKAKQKQDWSHKLPSKMRLARLNSAHRIMDLVEKSLQNARVNTVRGEDVQLDKQTLVNKLNNFKTASVCENQDDYYRSMNASYRKQEELSHGKAEPQVANFGMENANSWNNNQKENDKALNQLMGDDNPIKIEEEPEAPHLGKDSGPSLGF